MQLALKGQYGLQVSMTHNHEAIETIALEAAQAIGLEAEDVVAFQAQEEETAWHVKLFLSRDRGLEVQVAINHGDSRDTVKEALKREILLASNGLRV